MALMAAVDGLIDQCKICGPRVPIDRVHSVPADGFKALNIMAFPGSRQPASSADWLARGFPGPPLLVSTFVPEIFPAVVRVLNPLVGAAGQKHSWATVAQELDIPLNAAAVGDRLCQDHEANTGEKINVDFGTLDYEIASALADVLSRHTTTPDKCFIAAQIGYSDIRDEFSGAPVVILPPEREMYLLEGPVEAATEAFDE